MLYFLIPNYFSLCCRSYPKATTRSLFLSHLTIHSPKLLLSQITISPDSAPCQFEDARPESAAIPTADPRPCDNTSHPPSYLRTHQTHAPSRVPRSTPPTSNQKAEPRPPHIPNHLPINLALTYPKSQHHIPPPYQPKANQPIPQQNYRF